MHAYGHGILNKPRILVLNKKELIDQNKLNKLYRKLDNVESLEIIAISAVTKEGLENLLRKVWEKLDI